MKKVLLTSVCRPLGERYGDGPSVGYELLFGQVTRAQGLFSPRATHVHFSLEYIAENLKVPAVVLQYPSRRELIRELKKGYDYVAVSFLLAVFHRMKEVVALIREYSPSSKIILGGYGTVLSDDVLKPYADHICREEGVGFMRRLFGEPEIPMPYPHPLIVSRLKVFGMEVSRTGMVFAGLGCPNGCDFCCTSHYFKRRHIRLLPTGQDIYRVIDRYLEIEPEMGIVVLDEDFLLNKKRAMEFRDCVLRSGRPISIFVFASIRAISQYTVTEILEMGIDGIWIGYEGTRSGYAKQKGRPVDEVFREFREHGIAVLASMIVGLPYQTPEIIEEELSGLLALRPTLSQFLIYGPTPGTPFYQRIMEKGLLHKELTDDPERYYYSCTGFKAMVRHPGMSPEEIEDAQARCFDADFKRLGPSIYRSVETWLLGYIKLKDSPSLFLRMKAKHFAFQIRRAYPVFLAGRLLGPSREIRFGIRELQQRVHGVMGPATWTERVQSIAAAVMAAWTGLTLRLGLFQHPRLLRHAYRLPAESLPSRAWRQLRGWDPAGHRIQVELRRESTVWVQVEGKLRLSGAERLAKRLREAMARTKERLVLDFKNLAVMDKGVAEKLAESLHTYRSRIRVAMPPAHEFASLAALFALYH